MAGGVRQLGTPSLGAPREHFGRTRGRIALGLLTLTACAHTPRSDVPGRPMPSQASPSSSGTVAVPSPLADASPPSPITTVAPPKRSAASGTQLVSNGQPPVTGDVGGEVPIAWIASAGAGHWTAVCEAPRDTDGDSKLRVRITQHGQFDGDTLQHVLYAGSVRHVIDEFAGADPSGRYVAYVAHGDLHLHDTTTNHSSTLPNADLRATLAPFQSLRSVAFSDDGAHFAYVRGERAPSVVVRDLSHHTERVYTLSGNSPSRIHFAPGGRFLRVEVPLRDTNKNGRLDWRYSRRKGPAPCPSPIATFHVWQFPGDDPDTQLLDLNTGNLLTPEGFVLATGNVIIGRAEDKQLLAETPDKPAWVVSSPECNGRVQHVDPRTGAIVFGCANAWGRRRDMYLRTQDLRIPLGFDLAAYELDGVLPTIEPILPFYPGNQSWLLNVRTRERWQLLDGTQVHAVSGTTALVERELEMVVIGLNRDATTTQLTAAVKRSPFSGIVRQGPFVAVGSHLFDLGRRTYVGQFAQRGTPLALSHWGAGLFPHRPATPSELATGPLSWREVSRKGTSAE